VRRNDGRQPVSGHCWTCSRAVISNSVATQRLDQASLGRRQQLRQHSEVTAASCSEPERGMHVDPNYVTARREPQLSLPRQQDVPDLMLLAADQGVLAIGAEPAVGSTPASGAAQAAVAAGPAVFGPSARLKVPAAESPDPLFAAFSSTCSPTG